MSSALDGKQPLDSDLTAIAALTGTGYAERTGDGVWQLSVPAGGIALPIEISDVTGLSSDLSNKQPLDSDFLKAAALS